MVLPRIVSNQNVNQDLYDALTVLQHRGQDAAGIATCEGSRLHLRKDNGLARDVFSSSQMVKLQGNMGIGHVRYPTAGCTSSAEAQPFYVNSPFGLTLAHNGNLTNTEELKIQVFADDQRHINTDSDSEVLLNVFAHELQQSGKLTLSVNDVFEAVSAVHKRCRGAYAVVVMIAGFGVLGFRDPHGIRPIVFGERKTEDGTTDYMIASESVALDVLDFHLIRDIAPGEAVFIEASGKLHTNNAPKKSIIAPVFLNMFILPDRTRLSTIFPFIRRGCGWAKNWRKKFSGNGRIMILMWLFRSPIPAAPPHRKWRMILGVKFREGFMKNRYIGRTFIMPGQKMRQKSVRQKLNAISLEFSGKNVLLVDDSVVRGTTSEQIIQMAQRCRRQKSLFRFRCAAGTLSKRLRHRHAGRSRIDSPRQNRAGGLRSHRRG